MKPSKFSEQRTSFIGRVQEQRQFRIALDSLLDHHRRWRTLASQHGPQFNADRAPRDETYTRIFLLHGIGGIGKSWLTRRCLEIARAVAVDPPILTLYEDVSLGAAVLTPVDLLNRLHRQLVQAGAEQAVVPVRQLQTRLAQLTALVSRYRVNHRALWESCRQRAADALAAETGARPEPEESHLLNRATDLFLGQMADIGLLSSANVRLLQNPALVQAEALVAALKQLVAQRPLVIALDNLETVVSLEPFIRDHLVLPTVYLPMLWILSGRHNLADERVVEINGQERVHKGYRDLLGENPPLVWDMSAFGDADLREYLAEEAHRRGVALTIDDRLVAAVKATSSGIPLVVEMVADALFALDRDEFLQNFVIDDKTLLPVSRLEQVTTRFLRYCLTREDDLERVQALALLRRNASLDALAAVWALPPEQNAASILRELGQRYAFVQKDGLHDAIYEFLRRQLHTHPDYRSVRNRLGSRAVAFYRAGWQSPHQHRDASSRLFTDSDWQETTRSLLNALLWVDRDEAMRFFLPRFVEGLAFDRTWAAELLHQFEDFLGREADPALNPDYAPLLPRLRAGLKEISLFYDRPGPDVERMLSDLLTAPVWEDLHFCILHLWQGLWLVGQEQEEDALTALLTAEEYLPEPADSLREQLGQAFYHLSRRFLWPGGAAEPVPSELGLQAARRAVALTPQHAAAWYSLGIALEYLDRPDEAIAAYRQAIELAPSAAHYTSLGDAYAALSDYEPAVQAYRQALALDDSFAWAWHGLGVIYSELGDYESAERSYRQAIDCHVRDTDRAASWDGLGDVLAAMGRYEDALDAYRQAVSLSPDDALVWYSLGNMYSVLECYDEAIEPYRRAIELDSTYAWAYQNLGLVYERRGDYTPAMVLYQQAIERHTTDSARAIAWNSLGDVYTALERPEDAVDAYQRAVELDPEHAAAWNSLGRELERLGQHNEAIRAYRRIIKLTPDDPLPWFNLGNVCSALNRDPEAIEAYRRAIELNPDNAWAYNNLGYVYYKQGQYQQAIELYLQAIDCQPDGHSRAVAWDNLGNAYLALQNYEEAIPAFQWAIKLDPDYAWPYHNLGNARAAQGNYEAAISLFKQAIERHTDDADRAVSWSRLADVYATLNRFEEAIAAYQRVIELNPADAVSWYSLGNVYRALDRGTGEEESRATLVIDAYRRAIELDPEFAWPYHNLGLVYEQQQKYDEALRHFLEAIDRHKSDADRAISWAKVGDVYRAQQRLSPAIEAYQRAVRLDPTNPQAHYSLGRIYAWERRDYKRAAPLFQQAAQHFADPQQQARAWNNLGDVYRLLKQYPEAIDAYRRATELDGSYAQPWNSVGDVCRLLGQPEEAIDAYRRAIELDPDYAWPYHSLGLIYSEQGEEDRAACESAITLYRQAIERHESERDRARAWNNLGSTYQTLDRYTEAIKAYRQAIELDSRYALPWHNLGRVYQALSYPEDAIDAYQEALTIDPKDALAWASLGDVYRGQERLDEAIDAYKKAIQYNPNYAPPYFSLGLIYEAQEAYDSAIAVFKQAINRDEDAEDRAVVWTHLGDIYFHLEQMEEAEQAYRRAMEADDKYAWAYHSLGLLYAYREDYETAIGLFQQAIERRITDRGRAESWRHLGEARHALNRHEEAMEAYHRVIELDPQDAAAWNSLGAAQTALEHYEAAIRAFEQAIELDPDYAWPYHNLGYVYEKRAEYEAAVPYYQKAIERHESDEDAAVSWNNLGNVYNALNRLEEAEEAYRQAIALKSDYALPWDSLGEVYRQLGRAQEAIEAYQQAINLDPSYAWPYHNLALVYAGQQTYDSALALYERAIERHVSNQDRAITWNNLGKVYYALGRQQDAIAAYSRAIELDPTYAWSYNNLGVVYAAMGNFETAINLYRRAIECHEDNEGRAVSWDNLGNVYATQGRYQEAIDAYQRAIELNPSYALSWNALGNVYLKLERYTEAIDAYRQAIQRDAQMAFPWHGLGDVYHALARQAAGDDSGEQYLTQAVEAYRQAIELDPRHPWSYHCLAVIYEAQDNVEQALTHYQQAAARYESEAEKAVMWCSMGHIYRRLQQFKSAIEAYRKAIALDAIYAAPWHSLGNLFMDLSRHEDAVNAYRKAIELDPDNAWSYHNLGLVYEALQDYEAAISLYEQALERHQTDRDCAASWHRLGEIFHQWGRYEEALSALRRAAELDPAAAAPWISLGDVYKELDRQQDTIAAYRRAIELDPTNAQPYNNLGFYYEQLGRYEEAMALYRQVIDRRQNPADQAVAWNNLGNVLRAMGREAEAIDAYSQAMELDPNFTWPYHNLGAIYENQGKYEEALALYQRATKQFKAVA